MARSRAHALVAPFVSRWRFISSFVVSALSAGVLLTAGCGEPCCTVDSAPILVGRAPLGQGMAPGGLLARARLPGGGPAFDMVVDTASPVTILAGPPTQGTLKIQKGGFDLLDGRTPALDPVPVRARFRNLGLFSLPLGPVGDVATPAGGVIGGDLMHAFSMEMRFRATCPGADADAGAGGGTCSSVTFWPHQGASLAFLEDAGYAVVRFPLFGGGETTASSQSDFLGLEGPVTIPATRIVFRGCAAPEPFVPETAPRQACCTRGDEVATATGIDLALLLATGVGPMVLSRNAWMRIAPKLPAVPAMTHGLLFIATWNMPIEAEWTTLPRLALVDGAEPPPTGDEGPCVDLARSRRIEWTALQTAKLMQAHADVADCVQPCDTDPGEPNKALNSAAYIELGGDIPVAVVDDAEPFLQSLRLDIRTEGPDIDGLIGAAALGSSRVELDYVNDPPRAIFSCEPGTPRDACWSGARCPRLPDVEHEHLCFGLPPLGLPVMCAPSGCP